MEKLDSFNFNIDDVLYLYNMQIVAIIKWTIWFYTLCCKKGDFRIDDKFALKEQYLFLIQCVIC